VTRARGADQFEFEITNGRGCSEGQSQNLDAADAEKSAELSFVKMENIELRDLDLQNFDLLTASGFRELEEIAVPAWLVNVERRMAFDLEACAAADPQWLRAVITERVGHKHFAFYLGPESRMDRDVCEALLRQISFEDFLPNMFRVRPMQNSLQASS
jgi:hypothetical protein